MHGSEHRSLLPYPFHPPLFTVLGSPSCPFRSHFLPPPTPQPVSLSPSVWAPHRNQGRPLLSQRPHKPTVLPPPFTGLRTEGKNALNCNLDQPAEQLESKASVVSQRNKEQRQNVDKMWRKLKHLSEQIHEKRRGIVQWDATQHWTVWVGALIQAPAQSLAAPRGCSDTTTKTAFLSILSEDTWLFDCTDSRCHFFLLHGVDVILAGVKLFISLPEVSVNLTMEKVRDLNSSLCDFRGPANVTYFQNGPQ